MKYIMIGLGGLGFVLALAFVFTYINYSNQEVDLRNQVNAKITSNQAEFDNTWKIIQQQAGVSDQYKQAFKDIYPALMGERYKDGEAQLAKFVQEANPTFDTSLYKKLMDSIEVQRNIFTRKQNELIDKNLEHTNLVTKFPGSFIVGGRGVIKIPIVTSDKTKKAFESEEDNDVSLFPSPTPAPAATPAPVATPKTKAKGTLKDLPVVAVPVGK